MTDENGAPFSYVTVEVYDQVYHLSGQDEDHIRDLAARVDAKMRAVAAQGRTADSLRVAVLAALNLADELSQLERAGSSRSNSTAEERPETSITPVRFNCTPNALESAIACGSCILLVIWLINS